MTLLNYTTQISVEKTASEIVKILSKHGANGVLLEFEGPDLVQLYAQSGTPGQLGCISFKVNTNVGECAFRLPADWRATLQVLRKTAPRPYHNEAQARRVAWRIIMAWVNAQMALLETGMVKMEQIFLPYMVANDGRTFYEVLAAQRFLLKEG